MVYCTSQLSIFKNCPNIQPIKLMQVLVKSEFFILKIIRLVLFIMIFYKLFANVNNIYWVLFFIA